MTKEQIEKGSDLLRQIKLYEGCVVKYQDDIEQINKTHDDIDNIFLDVKNDQGFTKLSLDYLHKAEIIDLIDLKIRDQNKKIFELEKELKEL